MDVPDHRICELEKQVAVLQQAARDAATAIVLARSLVVTQALAAISILGTIISLVVALRK